MAELGHLAGLNSVVSSTRADGQAMISIEQGALLGAVIGVVLGWPEYTRAPWMRLLASPGDDEKLARIAK